MIEIIQHIMRPDGEYFRDVRRIRISTNDPYRDRKYSLYLYFGKPLDGSNGALRSNLRCLSGVMVALSIAGFLNDVCWPQAVETFSYHL